MFAAYKSQPVQRLILPLMALLALAIYAWREPVVDGAAAPTRATTAAVRVDPVAPSADKPVSSKEAAAPAHADAAVAASAASATGMAHRASSDQRQRDRERLERDPDLVGLETELKARAQAGDADAAWALADLEDGCAVAAELGAIGDALEQQIADMKMIGYSDLELTLLRSTVQGQIRRCSQLPTRNREAWRILVADARARAAALGHPGAQLAQRQPRGPAISPEAVQANLRAQRAGVELMRLGEPTDLLRYASELASISPYHAQSYVFAACTLLDGCLSDPTHYGLTHDPFVQAGGNPLIYLRELSPRMRLIVEAQSAEILQLWRARQFEQLLSGPLPPPGSGGG